VTPGVEDAALAPLISTPEDAIPSASVEAVNNVMVRRTRRLDISTLLFGYWEVTYCTFW
jgi:hypothetical protein